MRWQRGVQFRHPSIFSGRRVFSLTSDVDRKRSRQLAHSEELFLRAGLWYHAGIATDEAYVVGFFYEDGCLPSWISYYLAVFASWEWSTRVLRWPFDLVCLSWSVTAILEHRKNRELALAERHALFIRIISVRSTCLGEDFAESGRDEYSTAEDGL